MEGQKHKLSVELDIPQYEWLKRESENNDCTINDLIREAVDHMIGLY